MTPYEMRCKSFSQYDGSATTISRLSQMRILIGLRTVQFSGSESGQTAGSDLIQCMKVNHQNNEYLLTLQIFQ